MRWTGLAVAIGLVLVGCTAVVDAGRFHGRDGQAPAPDAGTDAFVPDAFVPDAFVPDAFVPDAFVPPDAGPCSSSCAEDEGCCDDVCVALDTLADCGACDNACTSPPNAVATCDGTACGFTCNAGFADCNGLEADGCEADLTSPTTCGGCGACPARPSAVATCDGTMCGFSCDENRADCNGLVADGCETDLSTITTCGGCGTSCAPTELCEVMSGSYTCVNGCSTGTTPCGTSCVDTTSSMSHCGACDAACTAPLRATATCVDSGCQRTCMAGFADCNGNINNPAGDGCEVTLATDANHCGACGTRCALTGASTRCDGSMCRITSCDGPTADCDGLHGNGCETDLRSRDNCGGCGIRCGLDQDCVSGTCRACTPTVVTVPAASAPPRPVGMNTICQNAAGGISSTCPVAQCGALSTWAFSYSDNRFSFGVVTYEPSSAIVRILEAPGGRYVSSISLDAATQQATFHGQGGGTATIPWSQLRLP